MQINENTTLRQMEEVEELKPAMRYLVGCADKNLYDSIADTTIRQMNDNVPQWSVHDLAYGLQRVTDVAKSGVGYLHSIYSQEEIEQDPQKADCKLFYLPAKRQTINAYMLLCSGGGYHNVCNPQEAFPVAARLNELGITVFALDYRTYSPQLKESGVVLAAVEDVAAALKYIDFHSKEFGVTPGEYAMGGFSAGGNLTAMWGTSQYGYKAYDLPKPQALLLDYAVVWFENPENMEEQDKKNYLDMLGSDWFPDQMDQLAVTNLVDEDYPNTVLVQCEDDDTVPFENWIQMKAVLGKYSVPYLAKSGAVGGHGYGLGTGTSVEGWVDEAVEFWKNIMQQM